MLSSRLFSTALPRRGVLLVVVLLALLATPILGQGKADEVVEQLQESYDVLQLSDGWLLQPRDGRDDYRAIEIRDGRVAVDGEWVDESELKRFVDADATLIFDLAEGRASSAPISPVEPPEAPEPPRPAPSLDDQRDDRDVRDVRESRELRLEELERVREQLEDAIERAREGEVDGEVRDRLRDFRDLENMPREIGRLQRELERVIERSERRGTRRGRDAQVTLGSDLVVERDEKVSEAVVISGDLEVLGEVDGDTTVVLGNARVEGFIDGTLVVVGGNIDVGPNGEIDGDAIAVGGSVHTAPGGHIDGEVIHLDFGELLQLGDVRIGDFNWPHYEFFDFGVFDTIGRIFRILVLAVLALLAYVLVGAKVEEVSSWVRGAPWRSLFSGLAVEIAFVPAVFIAFVLLCVSVIGLLVACFVPPLALFILMVVFLLGYTSVVLSIGDWIAGRFGMQRGNRYVVILIGMAAVEIWSIFGDVVGMIPFFGFIGALILFGAWCFKFVVWTVGLGAAVLCQFSRDPSGSTGSDWHLPPTPTPPAPPSGYESDYDAGYDRSFDTDEAEYEEDREYPLLEGDDIPDEDGADRDSSGENGSEDADEESDRKA